MRQPEFIIKMIVHNLGVIQYKDTVSPVQVIQLAIIRIIRLTAPVLHSSWESLYLWKWCVNIETSPWHKIITRLDTIIVTLHQGRTSVIQKQVATIPHFFRSCLITETMDITEWKAAVTMVLYELYYAIRTALKPLNTLCSRQFGKTTRWCLW